MFTKLWQAAYFERRLTRQKVEEINLNEIVQELIKYYSQSDIKVDFRRAVSLLQGLHVLYTRKMNYLLRDSEHLKKSMTDPLEVIKVEENQNKDQLPRVATN